MPDRDQVHYITTSAEPYIQKLLEAKSALVDSILEGSPMNLIAITNPSDESAESGFVQTQDGCFIVDQIIPRFGDKIENGAQIVIVNGNRVWQYIAERVGDDIWIRSNNTLGDYVDTEDVGPYISQGSVAPPPPPVDLETFTVFGENDNAERFVAVVTATEDTVEDVAVKAGLVDEGFESDVDIHLILKGDQSDLETVTV